MARQRKQAVTLKFDQTLVLNQWILDLFEVDSFDALATELKDPDLEGFTENNQTRFYEQLKLKLWDREGLPKDDLLVYDENIVRHWRRITEKRNHAGHVLLPKYFQYLSLLFAELYLDRYFNDWQGLINGLNEQVKRFNETPNLATTQKLTPFVKDDLRKIAFWNATGSGKTLLMHVNILQYQHYLAKSGRERELNKIILLTPNEGLSIQHEAEFDESDIAASIFNKEEDLFHSQVKQVNIIDIHKLRDEAGEKTVSVEAFEGNNLVLVDEGHRGSSGTEWKSRRDQICAYGFSFEYSATFGQAMKTANAKLRNEYSKCVIFDYSYKYFYRDGYGKDYRILNLQRDDDEEIRELYLTACLLVYYQQLKLYGDKKGEFSAYLLEKPLWVFVGGSVTKSTSKRDISDIVDILTFLGRFIQDRPTHQGFLERLLVRQAGLLDDKSRDIFLNAFTYVDSLRINADDLFDDILNTVFNAPGGGALHIENLKGADGEIALHVGDNDPFGVINVGDPNELCKLCEKQREFVVTDRDFSGSIFNSLNDSDSLIHVLIGSKKFMEGWNSWRVSTMGLMNVGRKEGSQIIQLFGRGVRLKGYQFNLKRSRHVQGITAPEHLAELETLNVFGIRADYMQQFKEYLDEEGLPPDGERHEFVLPVVNLYNEKLKGKKLKVLQVDLPANAFKRQGPKPTLAPPKDDEHITNNKVLVDWYPKIQAQTAGHALAKVEIKKDEGHFTNRHVAFMDMDAIYFALQEYKNEKAWHNLNLPKSAIKPLLAQNGWYTLLIPQDRLTFERFERVKLWQEIAIAILKKYCEKYYTYRKSEFEAPHLKYLDLAPDDDNFIKEYRFRIDESMTDIVSKLEEITEAIENGDFKDFSFSNFFQSICFEGHLYQPLIYCDQTLIQIKPVALKPSERDFVDDLRKFHKHKTDFFADKELYLLRNQSRGKGIGFFEAGNFYPDFIMWLVIGDKQYINFIDPKGLRNVEGVDDPKVEFSRTIKELEARQNDPDTVMNSFITSITPYQQIKFWGLTKEELEDHHVFFQKDDKETYIQKIMDRILTKAEAPSV